MPAHFGRGVIERDSRGLCQPRNRTHLRIKPHSDVKAKLTFSTHKSAASQNVKIDLYLIMSPPILGEENGRKLALKINQEPSLSPSGMVLCIKT